VLRGRPKLTWEEAIKGELQGWNVPKDLSLNRSAYNHLKDKETRHREKIVPLCPKRWEYGTFREVYTQPASTWL